MNSFGKCTEKRMLAFEEKRNVQIPSSYKLLLKETNGIVWDDGICISVPSTSEYIYVDALFGLGLENNWLDMDYWLEQYGDELPSGTLIIGSDVLEGFIIILDMPETSGIFLSLPYLRFSVGIRTEYHFYRYLSYWNGLLLLNLTVRIDENIATQFI